MTGRTVGGAQLVLFTAVDIAGAENRQAVRFQLPGEEGSGCNLWNRCDAGDAEGAAAAAAVFGGSLRFMERSQREREREREKGVGEEWKRFDCGSFGFAWCRSGTDAAAAAVDGGVFCVIGSRLASIESETAAKTKTKRKTELV